MNQFGAMAKLYLRTVVRSRRTLILALLYLASLLFMAIGAAATDGDGAQRMAALGTIQFLGPLGLLLPFGGLFFGMAVLTEEAENGTLPYLLVRPISRRTFLLSRLVAAWAILAGSMLVMELILLAVLRPQPLGVALAASLAPALLGAACYLALFALFAALFRRLAPALLFLVIWELGLSVVKTPLRYGTVKFHLLSLHSHLSGISAKSSSFSEKFYEMCDLSLTASLVFLAAVLLLSLTMASWRFNRLQA